LLSLSSPDACSDTGLTAAQSSCDDAEECAEINRHYPAETCPEPVDPLAKYLATIALDDANAKISRTMIYTGAMCGRYVSPDQAAIEREFALVRTEWRFPPSYNVAPTQRVPIIRSVDGELQGSQIRWGLIPFFAKGEPPKYSTINARIETVETAASYRGPWKRGQRCLQIATGFYEWHMDASERKAPYYIHVNDQPVFAFAGLWDRSVKADGAAGESCVHITMPANALMADIHNTGKHPNRMPAILRREDVAVWLNGSVDDARAVLKQYDSGLMVAHEVSTAVNSPKNNTPQNIEPAARSAQ
jgi:putative SOS response-associated peptidase YedK